MSVAMRNGSDSGNSSCRLSLTDVESFSFLFKSVWRPQSGSEFKFKLNLLDVILFHDGTPFRWLFTSRKSGEVMKKRNDKLTGLLFTRSFKAGTTSLNTSRSMSFTYPVATVWYAASSAIVKSYLVNESGLTKLLERKELLNNVLAIQQHFTGQSLKGSGVFEHLVALDLNGRREYQTTELAHPTSNEYQATILPCPNKLSVTRAQHSSIKDISRRLVKAIEISATCVVVSIVIQIGFDSSWTPHIITARDIVLKNMPSEWHTSQASRERVIYARCIHPKICETFSERPPDLHSSNEVVEKKKDSKSSEANSNDKFVGKIGLIEDDSKRQEETSVSVPIGIRINDTRTFSITLMLR